ncbi:MAG: peptidase T [Flavobacteriales bacterium]|nr:peptidase T [Bacteroidales bacterium AH-315-I05]PCJ85165.1 MAG: peptidase T [Flavobacteriales bacterium]
MNLSIDHTVAERFLRYVKIDTQSDPESPSCPSTEKQKNLGKLLVEELKTIGIEDAAMDEHGYVYATIPANTDKEVPVICFCSHMDTSPDCSGKDVNPILHENYDGTDIVLPKDHRQVLRVEEHPDLKKQVGNTVITTDGTTLLGADNKAGVAEIMDAANFLMKHPEVRHGKIRILFTPDEEIGRGVDKVDMGRLAADFGYTVDGETLGSIEDETFSADGVTLTVNGFNIHPGFAKNKLENAVKIASEIIDALPKDGRSPETTEGREGFIHPYIISGNGEQAVVKFIIRSFETAELNVLEDYLKSVVDEVISKYPRSTSDFEVQEQYRNMKLKLDEHPEVAEYAVEAMKRAGLEPKKGSIRGGTDGSRLSFMGLPCPNIFAGEHAFHSKLEWASVEDMQKAVETIIHLSMVWEEKA